MTNKLINFEFDLAKKYYSKNIYAIRLYDGDRKEYYDIAIQHNDLCPELNNERDESRFNDYLSNLEFEVIEEFYRIRKVEKPKSYYNTIELLTDSNGEIYRLSRSVVE